MENFFNYITGKGKYRAMVAAAAATPIVIFAGILIAQVFESRARERKHKKIQRFPSKSVSVGALHGGKLAWQRLVDYHAAQMDAASLHAAETELKNLLEEEQPDLDKLQRTVAKLEMSGKEEHALAELEKAVERVKKGKKLHEAYEIEMLLVEMLIYKGDFEKAYNCECLKHEEISDARRPLYKAILHVMLDHPKEEAKICWDDFQEIQGHFQWPPSFNEIQVDKVITDFKEFEKVVKVLKDDITKAHAKK